MTPFRSDPVLVPFRWSKEALLEAQDLSAAADPTAMMMTLHRCVLIVVTLVAVMLGMGSLPGQEIKRIMQGNGEIRLTAPKPGGVTFDGTNLFFAAQYTNGAIVLARVPGNLALYPAEWSLGRTGGVPRIAFDGVNLLVVWPDSGNGAWDIYGQLLDRHGSNVSGAFLIEADADAEMVGGLAFDGTNYLAVWEANARNTGAVTCVRGRFINTAGGLEGSLLEISTSNTAQKFPAVAWNGSEFLVAWTSRLGGSNAWSILHRRVSQNGVLSGIESVSEAPALAAWPPAVASDGTNWLTAWCRELGPFPMFATNAMIPAVRGRIVNGAGGFGGGEFEVRRGWFGQSHPEAAFDGKNYVVAWVDLALAYQTGQTLAQVFLREINPRGSPVATEMRIPVLAEMGLSTVVTTSVRGGIVCAWGMPTQKFTWGQQFVSLEDEAPVLGNFRLLTNGWSEIELMSESIFRSGIETSTDSVHWVTVDPSMLLPEFPRSPGKVTVKIPGAGIEAQRFFRALNSKSKCIENLRLLTQAKDHWAQDYNRFSGDTPTATDLFGVGRYLTNAPICPLGGTYYLLQMISRPTCSIAGHTN